MAAAALAVGAAATAGASQLINGNDIKPGSIPAGALSPKARKVLKGARGPVGPQGARGAAGGTGLQGLTGGTGPPGQTGDTGPRGPFGPQLIQANLNPTSSTGVESESISPANGTVVDGATAQVPEPVAVMADSLAVALSAATPHALTFTLYDGSNATALTCTVPQNGTACTDATDSVSVAAGDELSLGVALSSVSKISSGIPTLTAGISLELDQS